MNEKKLDMRYGRERAIAAARTPDEPAPFLYNARLLRNAKQTKQYRLGFRDIAAATSLSVNTVRDALDGTASKIEVLWKLCRYFEIPWIALFDIEHQLTVEPKKMEANSVFGSRYAGYEITAADLVTPETASSADEGGKE